MEDQRTRTLAALLPSMTGDEALLLTRVLQRLSDALWVAYGDEMAVLIAYDTDHAIDATTESLEDLDLPF